MNRKPVGYCLITFFAAIGFLLQSSQGIVAQGVIDSTDMQFDYSSPYNTALSHLQFLQDDNYKPDSAAKAFYAPHLTHAEKVDIAIKLKQIYDGIGFYLDSDDVSNNPNHKDSLMHVHRFGLVKAYPKIYLEKVGDKWLYSKNTVKAIPEIHAEVYPFGTEKLLDISQKLGEGSANKKVLGLYVWQLLGLLAISVLGFILQRLLSFVFNRLFKRIMIQLGHPAVAGNFKGQVSRPLGFLIVVFFISLFIRVLQLPIGFARYIYIGFNALLPILTFLILYRLVDALSNYLSEVTKSTETTLDDQLVPLIRRSLKLFIVAGGVLFTLQNLDFNVTGIVAGISIGGLALALAAQDTIKNLFGSLMIFVDKPFHVGDWIMGTDIDGEVEEVGFRSTRIRTFHNSLVSIPNGKIADMTIDNMGMRVYRRFKTMLSIPPNTQPEAIEAFVEGLRRLVAQHPNTRKDLYEIYLNDFGTSSLNILFYIFFNVPTWSEELRCRHEIMLEIIKLAHRLGIRFANPTGSLHIEEFPGRPSPPAPVYTKEELYAKIGIPEIPKK